jgi:HD superfamily phosphodiesterase
MQGPVDIWIGQVENTWLELLNNHVEHLFSTTFLPSHDHTHHRRVWNNCRKILKVQLWDYPELDLSLVQGVIIAAFFHDTGMVRSIGLEHGPLGKEICLSFFREREKRNNLAPPARFPEILEAIEKHDSKDQLAYRGDNSPDILGILSVADDLEAMGTIGIYRYSEIYLKRGISMRDLGVSILKNSAERYRNISREYDLCIDLRNEFRQKYDTLVSFFDMYNRQLLATPSAEDTLIGHIGVINQIRRLSVEGMTRPEKFFEQSGPVNRSSIVTDYFTELNNELEKAAG